MVLGDTEEAAGPMRRCFPCRWNYRPTASPASGVITPKKNAWPILDWIGQQALPTVWAIEVNGEAAGGIGVELHQDVERVSAEIGYWLGEAAWGRGIVTEALQAVTAEVFRRFELTRIYALPFADNRASVRVLEKAGYTLEGHLRQSAIKDGVILDQLLYAAYK